MNIYFIISFLFAVIITVSSGGSAVSAQGEDQDQYYYAIVCVIDKKAEMFALRRNEVGAIEFLDRNDRVTSTAKTLR